MIDMETVGFECMNGFNTDVFEEEEAELVIFLYRMENFGLTNGIVDERVPMARKETVNGRGTRCKGIVARDARDVDRARHDNPTLRIFFFLAEQNGKRV